MQDAVKPMKNEFVFVCAQNFTVDETRAASSRHNSNADGDAEPSHFIKPNLGGRTTRRCREVEGLR